MKFGRSSIEELSAVCRELRGSRDDYKLLDYYTASCLLAKRIAASPATISEIERDLNHFELFLDSSRKVKTLMDRLIRRKTQGKVRRFWSDLNR